MAVMTPSLRAKIRETLRERGIDPDAPNLKRKEWREIARVEQLRPLDCVHWLYLAGRGAGKTRSASERLRERLVSRKARYIALIGPTFSDVRDIMVEGESGLKAVCGDMFETYNRSNGEIVFKGGCRARFFSGNNPDALRGWQSTDVWGDEFAAWEHAQEAYDMAMFGLRLGTPESIWTTTPRPTKVVRALVADPSCKVTRSSTYANRDNLALAFFSTIVKKYEGTTLGRQELEGEILDDITGALWSRKWFDAEMFRFAPAFKKVPNPAMRGEGDGETKGKGTITVFEAPVKLQRIVVALDPTVSDPERKRNPTKDLDACGIIVAGIDDNGFGYVLGDFTQVLHPAEWSKLAVKLYDLTKSSGVIAEANQGGELIKEVIKSVSGNVPVTLVHASVGKRPRAEPLAMLYEQGRIRHCGPLSDLEDQMATWDASNPSEKSPNNVDAAVWAFHALGLCNVTGTRIYDRMMPR